MRKLVIISHTGHQLGAEGKVVGWGPTINEINHIADRFDMVEHVACLEKGPPKGSSLPYLKKNIVLRPIPTFGGTGLREKLTVVTIALTVLKAVREAIVDATHVQIRLPMGIGNYLLPFFILKRKRDFVLWAKYANNWDQKNAPLGYAFQRWMLRRGFARCKVTVNGRWHGQPSHCISFENPCLHDEDIEKGERLSRYKEYSSPFTLTFVGRLEDPKGVSRILDALKECDPLKIGVVNFVGDGEDMRRYREKAAYLGDKVVFHGFLDAGSVKGILSSSHFLMLPTTASEGFPKVVAEAACYGCIPLVSDLGSIPHYVEDGVSGFVWQASRGGDFAETLIEAMDTDGERLGRMAVRAWEMSSLFTFERYSNMLESKILEV